MSIIVYASMKRIVELILRAANAEITAETPKDGPVTSTASALLRGLLMDLDAQSSGDYGPAVSLSDQHRKAMLSVATQLSETVDHRLSVHDLASKMGYSPDHFTKTFKRIIGSTPKAYALAARIHRARSMLRNPGKSVSEIAFALGYDSTSTFSTEFKRIMGVTPTDYRQHGKPQPAKAVKR